MKDNYKKPTFHIWELLTKDFDLLTSSPIEDNGYDINETGNGIIE